MKIWRIANVLWVLFFVVNAAIIWFRETDGSGVTNSTTNRTASFIVLGIFAILVVVIQSIWYRFAKIPSNR
ncbi:DUF3923 family protein [Tetragenococcus koreensis]|uniref:DUF3923 family protein n=1 Tax=Tetragenococcus koreensis TaxID=290335 RepID=UPI001F3EECB2|nr:DUF3923 family protein [Tetragenococcus koreensis]MCF1618370.1 DUF3923 family protein [Tetragenococcus koreensis]